MRFGFVGGAEPTGGNRPARRGDGAHLGDSVSAFVDGRLDGAAGRRAQAHLATCPDCQREVADYQALKNRLTALASPGASQALAQRLLQLGDSALTPPATPPQPVAREPAAVALTGGLPGRRLRHPMLLLSASALVLGAGGAFIIGGGSGAQGSPEPVVTPPTSAYLTQHLEVSDMLPASDPVAHYPPSLLRR